MKETTRPHPEMPQPQMWPVYRKHGSVYRVYLRISELAMESEDPDDLVQSVEQLRTAFKTLPLLGRDNEPGGLL